MKSTTSATNTCHLSREIGGQVQGPKGYIAADLTANRPLARSISTGRVRVVLDIGNILPNGNLSEEYDQSGNSHVQLDSPFGLVVMAVTMAGCATPLKRRLSATSPGQCGSQTYIKGCEAALKYLPYGLPGPWQACTERIGPKWMSTMQGSEGVRGRPALLQPRTGHYQWDVWMDWNFGYRGVWYSPVLQRRCRRAIPRARAHAWRPAHGGCLHHSLPTILITRLASFPVWPAFDDVKVRPGPSAPGPGCLSVCFPRVDRQR